MTPGVLVGAKLVAGWLFGDWRRLAGIIGLLALAGAYIVGDARGRHAEAIAWQAKYDKLSHDFIVAADAAKTAETKRQTDIGAELTKEFQDQMAARDAADAKTQAATEAQIAKYRSTLTAGGGCVLGPADLGLLNSKP